MKWHPAALLVLILSTALLAGDDAWHTTPDQWRQPRLYHSPFRPEFADRITLGRDIAPPEVGEPEVGEPEVGGSEPRAPQDQGSAAQLPGASPNRAYWYAVEKPVSTQGESSMTIISIFNERPGHLQIILKDDRRYGPDVKWINEKLLFVRAWWGRVLGTDLIVDVERETIIYRETVHDGLIPFQQWKQAATAGAGVEDDQE